jgi:hypothetical protein
MYSIPKKVVTMMVITGTIIFTLGRLEVNIGLKMFVNTEVKIQISTP